MTKHNAAWWVERVEELSRGGDATEIAERNGVRIKTLIWWRSELQRRGKKRQRARLLPVVVASPPHVSMKRRSSTDLVVEIEIGKTRMTMRGVITAEHLAAVVTASARTC